MSLVQDFSAYSNWRASLSKNLSMLKDWLHNAELADAQTDSRLDALLERLRGDKLTIAFVAEFSRGKSELINALFFADYGQRILPSSAGRTTMCPTELQYDDSKPAQIELLPIETRGTHAAVGEFKRFAEEWKVFTFDVTSADSMQDTLRRVGEQKKATLEEAKSWGFAVEDGGNDGLKPDAEGMVEVPCWRHAIINFPHPLLEQGLVVLDTPGLNAIGAEPELTLSLLPSAHAILFILAADTGVTHTDLDVWRNNVNNSASRQNGRLVVLNKIDGLWDGLRGDAEIDAEIRKQIKTCAEVLELDERWVYPVSAQKALVGRINQDRVLLDRSRIAELEQALTGELIPSKQEIVADSVRDEANDIASRATELLDTRLTKLREQLGELTELRGKNQSVIRYMMLKVKTEKEDFERGLQQYYAVRSVFSNMTNNLVAHLALDGLKEETLRSREAMLSATFSRGLREGMNNFFRVARGNLEKAKAEIDEITGMLGAMYKRFSVEHGLTLEEPKSFSTLRYEKELDRLEQGFKAHLNTIFAIITTEKRSLTQKFFETVAVQVRRTYEVANRDIEQWLRAIMAPLESQVREYQLQLKRRLESVKRINQATDTLEERIAELTEAESALITQLTQLSSIQSNLRYALDPNSRQILEAVAA